MPCAKISLTRSSVACLSVALGVLATPGCGPSANSTPDDGSQPFDMTISAAEFTNQKRFVTRDDGTIVVMDGGQAVPIDTPPVQRVPSGNLRVGGVEIEPSPNGSAKVCMAPFCGTAGITFDDGYRGAPSAVDAVSSSLEVERSLPLIIGREDGTYFVPAASDTDAKVPPGVPEPAAAEPDRSVQTKGKPSAATWQAAAGGLAWFTCWSVGNMWCSSNGKIGLNPKYGVLGARLPDPVSGAICDFHCQKK